MCSTAIAIAACLGPLPALAEDFDDSVIMTCGWELNDAVIEVRRGRSAAATDAQVVRIERRDGLRVEMKVESREAAECLFANGRRFRVKVGREAAYSVCGADPGAYVSIWLDRRKIVNRYRFGGCTYTDRASVLNLQVFGDRVVHCQEANQENSEQQAASPQPGPLSACVDYPPFQRFPIDKVEYPGKRPSDPAVGLSNWRVVRGRDPICSAKVDAYAKGHGRDDPKFEAPTWSNNQPALPGLEQPTRADFDFDNDGVLDRVFGQEFFSRYMNGNMLLIELAPRLASKGIPARRAPLSVFLPCQLNPRNRTPSVCAPFASPENARDFEPPPLPDGTRLSYRARYASTDVYRYRGTTYVDLTGSTDNVGFPKYVVVLKPMPNSKFREMCVLHEVGQNL